MPGPGGRREIARGETGRQLDVRVEGQTVDPRVVEGLRAQLAHRAELLAKGAKPVGWKVGFNLPAAQKMFAITEPISGFLTTKTLVPDGEPHSLAGATQPMAEPELAIHIGADLQPDAGRAGAADAIAALGPAIEVADVDPSRTDLAEIVAVNVFHRAVRIGAPAAGASIAGVVPRATLNGEPLGELGALEATLDPVEIVRLIGRTIGAGGEHLRRGDVIIAGTLVPPPVISPGDELALDLGALGSLSLAFVV